MLLDTSTKWEKVIHADLIGRTSIRTALEHLSSKQLENEESYIITPFDLGIEIGEEAGV